MTGYKDGKPGSIDPNNDVIDGGSVIITRKVSVA